MSTSSLIDSESYDVHGERPCADGAPAIGEAREAQQSEYEEFFSGTVPCPSCRGLGRIPKELEQQMVAIIPLNDKRLRPSRAYIYVILAVVICILIGGCLLFFLLPRTISFDNSLKNIRPRHAVVNETERYVFLDVMVYFNVSNHNYFPVTLLSLEVFTVFDSKVIGQNTNTTHMSIPMRGCKLYGTNLNITFSGDEGYIAYYCSGTSVTHGLLLPLSAVATLTYMGHTEETTMTTYKYIECNATPDRWKRR